MATFTKRELIAALSAFAAVPLAGCGREAGGAGAASFAFGLNPEGVKAVAASYAAATDDPLGADVEAIFFPNGVARMETIRSAVVRDFTEGRIFTHAGWRLSHTEGRLFTLLARAK